MMRSLPAIAALPARSLPHGGVTSFPERGVAVWGRSACPGVADAL